MAAELIYDDDADLSIIQGRKVAVTKGAGSHYLLLAALKATGKPIVLVLSSGSAVSGMRISALGT